MEKKLKEVILKRIVSICLAVIMAISSLDGYKAVVKAASSEFIDGNLVYQVISANDKTVQVLRATNTNVSSIVIPDKVKNGNDEYTVTKICANAFKGYAFLLNVEISSSITEIGNNAFENASNLEKVIFDKGKEGKEIQIGDAAFKKCVNLTTVTKNSDKTGETGKVEFPESVVTIKNSAFYGDTKITSVDLSSVKVIENQAFGECTGLKSIKISDKLEMAGKHSVIVESVGAFAGCRNLVNVKYEGTITKIPDALFANCTGIEGFTIPDTVKEIGKCAFFRCTNLTEIQIPDSVETIRSRAFESAEKLIKVTFEKEAEGRVEKTIENAAFKNCTNLTTVAKDSGKNEEIGKVEIPDSIVTIPEEVFYGDTKITSVDLSSVKNIANQAFGKCTGITSIKISDKLEMAGKHSVIVESVGAFAGCRNLVSVKYEGAITKIPDALFANTGITSYKIPDTVTKIGDCAFYRCTGLTEIEIPDNVAEIGSKAFEQATGLKKVYVHDNVMKIAGNAFDLSDDLSVFMPMFTTSTLTFIDNERNIKFSDTINKYQDRYIVNSAKSSYTTNISNSVNNVTLIANYEMYSEKTSGISDMKLILKIPVYSEVRGIELNGKMLGTDEYTVSNKHLITIPVNETKGRCVLFTAPDSNGRMNSYAKLEYKKSGEICTDIIGAISEKCKSLSIYAANEVNYDTDAESISLEITGTGIPGKKAKIYADGVLMAEKTISKAGNYSAEIKLNKPENYKKYILKVDSVDEKNKAISASREVQTIKNCPELESASLYIEAHEYKNGYQVFDLLHSETIKYITFQPNKNYKFTVKYKNRDSIGHVYVVSERGGVSKKLEAKWNEEEQAYVTEGFFDNSGTYVPGNISIEYIKSASALESELPKLNDDGTVTLSEKNKAEIPEQWKEVTVEKVKDSEEESEAKFNLKNGAEICYKYNKLSLTDYAQEIQDSIDNEETENISKDKEDAIGREIIQLIISYNESKSQDTLKSIEQKLESYGYDKYEGVLQNNADLYIKPKYDGKKLVLHFFDPSSIEDGVCRYIVQLGENIEFPSLFEAMGFDESMAASAFNNLTSTGCFAYSLFGYELDVMNLYLDPTLSPQVREQKIAEIQKAARASLLSLMFTFLLNSASVFIPAGLELPALLLLAVIQGFVIPALANNEDLHLLLEGKVSLKDLLLKWIIDPSGYIYDGVTNNRLTGVTMTIYYKQNPGDTEAVLWNASEYDQENPILTDSIGAYAWDVPEGYWCVKAEKEGYETAYSDWMEVPPVRMDVNIKMGKTAPPQIRNFYPHETFAVLKFDQYMDPETMDNLVLKDEEGNIIKVNVSYDESEKDFEGNIFARKFTFQYVDKTVEAGTGVTIEVNKNIINSSGKGVEEETITKISKIDTAEDIHINSGVNINGFQISSTAKGISTLYSVEDIIDNKKVENAGIVYSLADRASEEELFVGSTSRYVRSYKATPSGVYPTNISGSDTATSYVMTMRFGANTAAEFSAKWRVRAYAELSDGSYVYSDAVEYTIYDIADELYQGCKMSNYAGHNYLYTDILKVVNPDYIEKEYEWSNSLV